MITNQLLISRHVIIVERIIKTEFIVKKVNTQIALFLFWEGNSLKYPPIFPEVSIKFLKRTIKYEICQLIGRAH